MDLTISPHSASLALRKRTLPSASGAAALPSFHTPSFDGPLDLLLHLIRVNEVDIYDIPITQITEQYLAHIAGIREPDLNAAGEYVVMAATLIEIKARMLLPLPPPLPGEEAEDPRAELVARLLEYERYQPVVEDLRGWEEQRRRIYFRGAAENTDDYLLPIAAGEASPLQLLAALKRLLEQSGVADAAATSVTARRRISLRLKMAEIARRTEGAGAEGLPFETLILLPCPRYDIVIAFLALLELLRSGRIVAIQDDVCGPIRIVWVSDHAS